MISDGSLQQVCSYVQGIFCEHPGAGHLGFVFSGSTSRR